VHRGERSHLLHRKEKRMERKERGNKGKGNNAKESDTELSPKSNIYHRCCHSSREKNKRNGKRGEVRREERKGKRAYKRKKEKKRGYRIIPIKSYINHRGDLVHRGKRSNLLPFVQPHVVIVTLHTRVCTAHLKMNK
jgi:hypothetical protein